MRFAQRHAAHPPAQAAAAPQQQRTARHAKMATAAAAACAAAALLAAPQPALADLVQVRPGRTRARAAPPATLAHAQLHIAARRQRAPSHAAHSLPPQPHEPPPLRRPPQKTVPVSQVTEMAKPLPKQTIDKTKVWVAFIGGAVTVFGLTVLSENNESWFPAISRANKAMEMSRKRAEVGRARARAARRRAPPGAGGGAHAVLIADAAACQRVRAQRPKHARAHARLL